MDPEVVSDWRKAKKQAAKLAKFIGAELLQMPDGGKRVLHCGKTIDCTTWLGCCSYCYRIYCDQQKSVPVAQEWTGPIPMEQIVSAKRITVLNV